jgi:hypothetical protein
MAFRGRINSIIVLLSQSITDKIIEGSTLASAHGLHQLWAEAPFKASNFLSIAIHKLCCIPCQIVKRLQIFSQTFIALR